MSGTTVPADMAEGHETHDDTARDVHRSDAGVSLAESKPEAEVLEDQNLVTPPEAVDAAYHAKTVVINRAIQDIGMGWYQYMLFIVVGFGWASDNLWPVVTSLVLSPIGYEFHKSDSQTPYMTLAQNLGLLFGAAFWGFGSDYIGRKWSFTLTLGITAVFGLAAAGSPTFAGACVFAALWSFGVGGNLPVDSAIFLEFLPGTHQFLLTVLSTYWALAQLLADLIAWPLLGDLTCSEREGCTKQKDMGWRYFLITLGGLWFLFFLMRFFFPVLESPKFLVAVGRDADAVAVVHKLAKFNKKTTTLELEDLQKYDSLQDNAVAPKQSKLAASFRRTMSNLRTDHITGLFATRSLAISTSLIMAVWFLIGLGYPLYNAFLPVIQRSRNENFKEVNNSVYLTYRNLVIVAVMGVPACILGSFMVELPYIGRKGSLAASTLLTGVFLFCSTTAKDWYALLGWQCAFNFASSFMYAVLYTYTPEIFPSVHRGTGNALAASANRIFGVFAPVIFMKSNPDTKAPIYVSGALFLVAGFFAVFLPIESRGRTSM